jgi:hypothetical protein
MPTASAHLPSFHRGQTVLTTEPCIGVRPMTEAEEAAWYVKAEGWGPHDADGEPWVCSGVKSIRVPAATVLEVVSANVVAYVGWHSRSGYAEVREPATGERFRVPRRSLRSA